VLAHESITVAHQKVTTRAPAAVATTALLLLLQQIVAHRLEGQRKVCCLSF